MSDLEDEWKEAKIALAGIIIAAILGVTVGILIAEKAAHFVAGFW